MLDLDKVKCSSCGGKLQEVMQSVEIPINATKKANLPDLPAFKCTECGSSFMSPAANQKMDRLVQKAILDVEIEELERKCKSCDSQERYEELLIEIADLRKQLEDFIDNP